MRLDSFPTCTALQYLATPVLEGQSHGRDRRPTKSPARARGRSRSSRAAPQWERLEGLIGLGGAEFRLPLLIGLFGFEALSAIIVNKAMSLVVVTAALPFRATAVPMLDVLNRWDVIATLLAGSLFGAWWGASWATRLHSRTLNRVIAALLLFIAVVLLFGHGTGKAVGLGLAAPALAIVGAAAGAVIGVVAALLGIAGGELLIPTIVLLFGADLKLAGSLSLAVSLPTRCLQPSLAIAETAALRFCALRGHSSW